MLDIVVTERELWSKDWATFLFIFCFILIAIARATYGNRFADFARLGVSDKYIKIYKDNNNLLNGFTIPLFIVQLISFTFLIQLILSYFGLAEKTNWITFVQLFTLICVFIISKYLIEKIIAVCFNIEEYADMFNLQKISYRTYIGFLLLPVTFILFYNPPPQGIVIYILLGIIFTGIIISYIVSLRLYQNLILGKLFYFILYLCTLEIAPYYFMYYWFTNSK